MKPHQLREVLEILVVKYHDMIFPHCNGGYWGVIPWDSRDKPFLKLTTAWTLPMPYQLFAKDMCKVLNTHLHLDGIWAVVWTDWDFAIAAPKRILYAYFDQDVDLQFVVDSDDPLIVMLQNPQGYVHQCAQAFVRWQEHVKNVAPGPDQKIKLAKGQPSVDPLADPGISPFAFD